jgi:flavin-dependent dehydrogenase
VTTVPDGATRHYDVLVYGSGPAACVLSIECVRRGLTVALVAREGSRPVKPPGETLSPRAEFLLRQAGLAEACLADQLPASEIIVCWDRLEPTRSSFNLDPHGRLWHLDRGKFDRGLLGRAREAGVKTLFVRGSHAVNLIRRESRWEVKGLLGAADGLTAHYLVDASGRSHSLARLLGARRVLRDTLVALWGCYRDPDAPGTLLIEASPDGWWYSLRYAFDNCVCAFLADPRVSNVGSLQRHELWARMLEQSNLTRTRLGSSNVRIHVALAESSRLDRVAGDGWFAVGDAATSFDPLSSNGLTSAIEQALHGGQIVADHADSKALMHYCDTQIQLFDLYLVQRHDMYRRVERFSRCAFWRSRVFPN